MCVCPSFISITGQIRAKYIRSEIVENVTIKVTRGLLMFRGYGYGYVKVTREEDFGVFVYFNLTKRLLLSSGKLIT